MGFLDNLKKAAQGLAASGGEAFTQPTNQKPRGATGKGEFTYLRKGTAPKKDAEGRVVVKVTSGQDLLLDVSAIDEAAERKLGGRPTDDGEIAKTTRVRLLKNALMPGTNGLDIFTVKGEKVAEVDYNDSEMSRALYDQIVENLRSKGFPHLEGVDYVLDVALRIEGEWVEDDADKPLPQMNELYLMVGVPVEIDIESGD